MSAHSQIAAFLEAQAAELAASENTLLAYGRDLTHFSDWLTDQGSDLDTARQETIESYLIDLDTSGLSRSTRARRLSAIRQYFRFAFEEGWRTDNPGLRIKGPKREKSLPKTLSEREVDAILDAARQAAPDHSRIAAVGFRGGRGDDGAPTNPCQKPDADRSGGRHGGPTRQPDSQR